MLTEKYFFFVLFFNFFLLRFRLCVSVKQLNNIIVGLKLTHTQIYRRNVHSLFNLFSYSEPIVKCFTKIFLLNFYARASTNVSTVHLSWCVFSCDIMNNISSGVIQWVGVIGNVILTHSHKINNFKAHTGQFVKKNETKSDKMKQIATKFDGAGREKKN